MPRMDGLELCRNLTNERPGIKVLMMSGALEGREQVSIVDCRSFKSRSPIRPCGMPSKRCLAPFGLCYDGDLIPSTARFWGSPQASTCCFHHRRTRGTHVNCVLSRNHAVLASSVCVSPINSRTVFKSACDENGFWSTTTDFEPSLWRSAASRSHQELTG